MKLISRFSACLALAMALTGCGGESPSTKSAAGPVQLDTITVDNPAAAYYVQVQAIYVAYFGRPADKGGLDYYANLLVTTGGDTSAMLYDFAMSLESQALYNQPTTAEKIAAMYVTLFSRPADEAGVQYWANLVDTGVVSLSQMAVTVAYNASPADLAVYMAKLQAAQGFTNAIDTNDKTMAYQTNVDIGRNYLVPVVDTATAASAIATANSVLAAAVAANSGPTFAQVQGIVTQRCVPCHSVHPTQPGFNSAPFGIMFDTEAQIRANANNIYQYAVLSHFMPYGNATGMTDDERALIGQWYTNGQK